MHGRRAIACVALGLSGVGFGTSAALRPGDPTGRVLAMVAGLCAGGAGLAGWLARPAGALAGGPDRSTPPGWRAGNPRPPAGPQPRRTAARDRAAADRTAGGPVAGDHRASDHRASDHRTGDPNGELVLSLRAPRDGEVLIDPVTGLYSERYVLVALDARIAAARRRLRPVSVVMIEVVVGLGSGQPTPADPQLVAAAVRSTLREADTASRTSEGRYVLVLEDTPENGAIWSVERLRSRLVGEHPDHTLWAGVACYPAHAFNLDEILDQAAAALEAAKEWRQDRIEVATVD